MNRELRIFLYAIFLPVLLLAWGGFRLIQSEGSHLDETDQAALASVAERAAAGFRETCHNEIDPLLDELAALPTTNEFAVAVRRLESTCPWVRRAYVSGERSRSFQRFWRSNENGRRPSLRVMTAAQPYPLVVELEPLYALARLPGILRGLGVDDPGNTSRLATIAEIRQIDDALLNPATSQPASNSRYGEASLGNVFRNWKVRVYRRYGEAAFESDRLRLNLLGGIVLSLLLCSLCVGGGVLLFMSRDARREARLKTNFISLMSHEFKTPLTTIGLCTELALADELDEDERRRAALSIQREANRLQRVLQDILDFSRVEAGHYTYHPAPFDLAALVREVVDFMKVRVEQPTIVADGTCEVFADRAAVELIIVNLLENAAKYARESQLVVSFAPSARPGFQTAVFADRGPGLTSEQCKHVFDRFWRADNSTTRTSSGSGLGLSIARGLARGMKGNLSVRTREGGGCAFTLELPAGPPGKV